MSVSEFSRRLLRDVAAAVAVAAVAVLASDTHQLQRKHHSENSGRGYLLGIVDYKEFQLVWAMAVAQWLNHRPTS